MNYDCGSRLTTSPGPANPADTLGCMIRPIVVTFDGTYARAAAALFWSLTRARDGKQTTVIAIVSDVPEGWCGLDLTFRDVGDACHDLPVSDHGSPAAYYRLLLSEMLPEFSSVVYVDCDAIFLRDPAELLVDRYEPYPVAAVQDLCNPTLSSPFGLPGYLVPECDRGAPYFNSGLMVMDLDIWRSMRLGPAARQFAREHPHSVPYWDQDALNAVLRGNWYPLDRRWNVVPLNELWTVTPFEYHGELGGLRPHDPEAGRVRGGNPVAPGRGIRGIHGSDLGDPRAEHLDAAGRRHRRQRLPTLRPRLAPRRRGDALPHPARPVGPRSHHRPGRSGAGGGRPDPGWCGDRPRLPHPAR